MRISTFVLIIACLLAFSLSIAHADLMEGLVVYFNFDQGETDIVEDLSGTGNNGIVHGAPKWVAGPEAVLGKTVEFDGAEAYIEVPDNDSMNVGEGDIAFMLWIKWEPDQLTDWPRPISKMALFGANKPGFDVLVPGKAGTVLQSFYGMSGAERQVMDAAEALGDGGWHHVVAMKDGNESKMYIDGAMVASTPVTPMNIDNEDPFNIGTSAQVAAHVMFKGVVDEVAFYTRALTEEEIGEAMGTSLLTAVEEGKLSTTWGSIKRAN